MNNSFYEILILIQIICRNILHFHNVTDYTYLFQLHQQYSKYNTNSCLFKSHKQYNILVNKFR